MLAMSNTVQKSQFDNDTDILNPFLEREFFPLLEVFLIATMNGVDNSGGKVILKQTATCFFLTLQYPVNRNILS